MNTKYFAITIGPIYQTIIEAKKTRELWAASFIFSLVMREILKELAKSTSLKILIPKYNTEALPEQQHGAGIWPDRCICSWGAGNLPDPGEIKKIVLGRICTMLKLPANTLDPYFRIEFLKADWSKGGLLDAQTDEDQNPVFRINKLLDNIELRGHFHQEKLQRLTDLLEGAIHELYVEGYNRAETKVFIRFSKGKIRLPSLPEIALHSFQKSQPELYADHVESIISNQVIDYMNPSSSVNVNLMDTDSKNEEIYIALKKALPDDKPLLLNQKYVAIVKADGDNLGTSIAQSWKGNESSDKNPFESLSDSLMQFSQNAVNNIVDYGGFPVYAGGDDLLFIAPVLSGIANCPDVFELCNQLDQDFQASFDRSGPTLSFGVSISYYKFPLGEAVTLSDDLLRKSKSFKGKGTVEKPEKHALTFQVQKHSGQQFGTSVGLASESSKYWLQLLKASTNLDQAFLTSVMHKLESLKVLLEDACKRGTLEYFKEHHFNEGGRHNKDYLKAVMELTGLIFEETQSTEGLFSLLRAKQFLMQTDQD